MGSAFLLFVWMLCGWVGGIFALKLHGPAGTWTAVLLFLAWGLTWITVIASVGESDARR